jgi:glycosyltransferase involved in cell wall biosynthesis
MMNLKQRIGKAWWSIKNEGVLVFAMKFLRFIPWVFGRTHVKYSKYLPKYLRANVGKYNSEFLYLANPVFEITAEDIEKSKALNSLPKPKNISTATWFVPYFDHINFGGIYTIFRFINYFSEQGVHNRIIIYDKPNVVMDDMKSQISTIFPSLSGSEVIIFNPSISKIADLPKSDIAICTFWASAYFLLKYNQTNSKYYFIQDYEPLFYEGGSTYALAESTYRFGFKGIVNTPGLLRAINQRHGLNGISFTPAVDPKRYYPPVDPKNKKRVKIFFYARPNNPRNAFNLGILIIKDLLLKYGDKIEIITAGSEWKESKYDLKGLITNLGLIKDIDQVADLYRTCDIGFVYMLSKHPSYQPFEFMATGVATVTNNNEDNLWFLKDGTNCLIAEPSPKAMSEKIGWLIDDKDLRSRIQAGGYKTVSTDWDKQLDIIWNDLVKSSD